MADYTTRIQCAAFVNGCQTPALLFKNKTGKEIEEFLEFNGWRLDYGKWICAEHPQTKK